MPSRWMICVLGIFIHSQIRAREWTLPDARLKVVCERMSNRCQFFYLGKILAFPFGQKDSRQWLESTPGFASNPVIDLSSLAVHPYGLYLVAVPSGDGCPIIYHGIVGLKAQHALGTTAFGNCNQISVIWFQDYRLKIRFPEDKVAGRKQLDVKIDLRNGRLF